MQIDKTTLQDLSFLSGAQSAFSLINRCTTQAGTEHLRQHVQHPPATYKDLLEFQDGVRFWIQYPDLWTPAISNGTLVMLEKFYESAEAGIEKPGSFSLAMEALMQKLFNKNRYSFIRFSISHLVDFLQGCNDLVKLQDKNPPLLVLQDLSHMQTILATPLCKALLQTDTQADQKELLRLSYHARRSLGPKVQQLKACYARLDAMQSLARATLEHNWTVPQLLPSEALCFEAEQLFHPLLQHPVPYDIRLSGQQHFLFLTGANMSGKSTLIRAMGMGALLAHLGMGVPAREMKISFLEGIITNMQVSDNIFTGESYFFAEVQRMKITAEKLSRSKFHLVLMDELFKGTNVHDAYECSHAVIDGLLHQQHNLMALSTHLNELSAHLQHAPGVIFRYCYTNITAEGKYYFTYQLKEGVSKDRIGYLVLKNEGVLSLLKTAETR